MLFSHCKSSSQYTSYPLLGKWYMRGIRKKLHLDELQNAKLNVLQNSLNSSKAYVDKIRQERNSMLDEVMAIEGFDRSAAMRFIKTPYLAFEEQAPAVIEAMADFYDSLDYNQRELLQEIWLQRQNSRHNCRH